MSFHIKERQVVGLILVAIDHSSLSLMMSTVLPPSSTLGHYFVGDNHSSLLFSCPLFDGRKDVLLNKKRLLQEHSVLIERAYTVYNNKNKNTCHGQREKNNSRSTKSVREKTTD